MENNQSNNKNVSLSLIAEYGGSDSESDDAENQNRNVNDDSDAPELSEMVLKNNIINACAHGPLSRDDCEDDETSARSMIIDAQSEDVGYEVTLYREDESESDSTSSSDSDSDIDSVKDIEEISSGDEESSTTTTKPTKHDAPKANGELGLDDLPPIEDLAISLPAQETVKIGTVSAIIEQLVIVKSSPGSLAVDLDSVLFLDNGAKALGKVFDVFGPVKEPHYAIRFNSAEHAAERGAVVGADVYIAPESQHTSYVFLPDLMKMKGSDASWKNDLEPPLSHVDYSDDEQERRARREARQRQDPEHPEAEHSKNRRPRNNRPSESSSRFGSGPSRGRNPFSAGSRRNPNTFPRYSRPFVEVRTPPPHPMDPNIQFGQPPSFPTFPPFNPATPPPFMYQYPRMRGPMPIPMGFNGPTFGAPFCSMPGPQPQWVNTEPPPPPST